MKYSETKQKSREIGEKLFLSKKYVKYQKPVSKIIWFSQIIPAVLLICFGIVMIFLPVFKIEAKLFDVTVMTKKFSLYDNFKMMTENYGENTVVIGGSGMGESMLIIVLLTLGGLMLMMVAIERLLNIENSTIKQCSLMKIDKPHYYSYMSDSISNFFCIIIVIIIFIIFTKNAEYTVSGDVYSEDLLEYIVYYRSDGSRIVTAYRNYFMLCNGVDNTIAIPAIIFIAALISNIVAFATNKKIKEDINKEVF